MTGPCDHVTTCRVTMSGDVFTSRAVFVSSPRCTLARPNLFKDDIAEISALLQRTPDYSAHLF